ncbi:hypothetical protein [Streptomyces telluris]|uniref:Uncharacterized protein n=1 Tax=Streptomyces telluris TaxID=2720021 RepID=A0A9X2LRK1_9ACTN|nr:hypothetical protein [Streptomyces telluris]MCQ8774260.1 hypothetical protein [Streptomyces telluris]NJP76262.1 hypothetical protein [Streptomyces telluris]
MIDSPRRPAAPPSTPAGIALGLVMCAIALITLALALADDLGDPAFFALIGAELLLTAAMGALFGASHKQSTTDAAQRQRDEEALAALEPLHGGEQR